MKKPASIERAFLFGLGKLNLRDRVCSRTVEIQR